MTFTTFDLDFLRSFVAGVELGNFAKAAGRLGRSTSAVSAQMRKLESQAGIPLLRKAGRGLELTEAGELLLGYARRLLDLNDEAVSAIGEAVAEGSVRIGMQQDFAETVLPDVLGRFARAHRRVRIDAVVARNAELLADVAAGRLDFALAWRGEGASSVHAETVADVPLCWVGPRDHEK